MVLGGAANDTNPFYSEFAVAHRIKKTVEDEAPAVAIYAELRPISTRYVAQWTNHAFPILGDRFEQEGPSIATKDYPSMTALIVGATGSPRKATPRDQVRVIA